MTIAFAGFLSCFKSQTETGCKQPAWIWDLSRFQAAAPSSHAMAAAKLSKCATTRRRGWW
jgi:hypothetical protein